MNRFEANILREEIVNDVTRIIDNRLRGLSFATARNERHERIEPLNVTPDGAPLLSGAMFLGEAVRLNNEAVNLTSPTISSEDAQLEEVRGELASIMDSEQTSSTDVSWEAAPEATAEATTDNSGFDGVVGSSDSDSSASEGSDGE